MSKEEYKRFDYYDIFGSASVFMTDKEKKDFFNKHIKENETRNKTTSGNFKIPRNVMKATKNYVIVKIDKDQWTKSDGGIIVNEVDKLPTEGVVAAVGPQCIFGLKKGDKVMFREQPGDLFDYKEERYYRMLENKIHGKLDS